MFPMGNARRKERTKGSKQRKRGKAQAVKTNSNKASNQPRAQTTRHEKEDEDHISREQES